MIFTRMKFTQSDYEKGETQEMRNKKKEEPNSNLVNEQCSAGLYGHLFVCMFEVLQPKQHYYGHVKQIC